MLATLIPAITALAIKPNSRISIGLRLVVAGSLFVFIMPLVLITGSRAGILAMVMATGGSYLLLNQSSINLRTAFGSLSVKQQRVLKLAGLVTVVAVCAIIIALITMGRAVAVDRLFAQDVDADARLRLFPIMATMARDYFPMGAGFGSFPTIFRIVEPDWYLRPSYFNHAHNDVVEVLIEGGLFAMILAGVFAAWWVRMAIRLWRAGQSRDYTLVLGRLGTIQTLVLILASVVDYPLRTPLLQIIFLLAIVLIVRASAKLTERSIELGGQE